MNWLEVLRDLGVFGFGMTVIGWAFRQWLQLRHDQEIEQLKADLKLAATEHEVRFRHLHDKVVDTVAETYGKLWQFFELVNGYVSLRGLGAEATRPSGEPSETKEQKHRSVMVAWDLFATYFYPRRIYFDRSVAGRIESLGEQLLIITNEFKMSYEARSEGESPATKWLQQHKVMKKDAEPLFRDLEGIFRKLIGHEDVEQDTQDGGKGGES